jgi:hypothetical protein
MENVIISSRYMIQRETSSIPISMDSREASRLSMDAARTLKGMIPELQTV